jgi:tRNA nucleotidyltransferase (CCA-adding enzyme)
MVGKSFGVLKIYGLPIDWSLPRTDSSGRKPQVILNGFLSLTQALERRDVTMNAMAINMTTLELFDPFGGYKDIQNKILRTPNPQFFTQDPLRFFRIMQFIGRFEMEPDEQLNQVCERMELASISRERIEEEMKKLLLLSRHPSRGLRWVEKRGRLKELFPELEALVHTPQGKKWHPEGDVFEHTMQALDSAASIKVDSEGEKLILLYATLCHDVGKATTTVIEKGRISSKGHDIEGVEIARTFLKRITHNQELIKTVLLLVRHHMAPLIFVQQKAKIAAYKRLARALSPYTNLKMLALLAQADKQGRNRKGHTPLKRKNPLITQFLKNAEKANIATSHEEPLIQGKDLIADVPAGPLLGKVLKELYRRQIEENITDKDDLKNYGLKYYKNLFMQDSKKLEDK